MLVVGAAGRPTSLVPHKVLTVGNLVPCQGSMDLRLGTKHDVIGPYMETIRDGTSVVVPPRDMHYSAAAVVKALSQYVTIPCAITTPRYLFLDRYLCFLNIHDLNKNFKVRCRYIESCYCTIPFFF